MIEPPDNTPVSSREFDARIAEIRRAVDLARDTAGSQVDLREYVERIFVEGQRATEMAEREREKAAAALTAERYNAAETAEREREKSAQALSVSLQRSIREGDERLREHIENQVHQIEAALESARRETAFADTGAQKAIEKAEIATDKRFSAVNAFREQLAEQANRFVPREVAEAENKDALRRIEANSESIAGLRNAMLPRERFETTVADWTAWREITDRRLAEQAGAARGITSSVGFIVGIAGVLLTVVIIVIGVLA